MAIGEAGVIVTNSPGENTPITVNFTEPLTDAVIVLTGTNVGGNEHSYRIIDVTPDSFTFIIEEWEYHDGPHGAVETINWLAIEEGTHTLPDGRTIVAGTTSATDSTGSVAFGTAFGAPPVVVTSVMSDNDSITVDSDPTNITANGFDVRLQEEQALDGTHAAETVGFIAIDAGGDGSAGTALTQGGFDETRETIGLGATYTNPIVVADTQTLNDTDPARVIVRSDTVDSIDLSLQEERSADPERNHGDETVGLIAFEEALIFCFTAGTLIDTPFGARRVEDFVAGDLVLTRDDGPQPVRWICKRTLNPQDLAHQPGLAPVLLKKDSIAPGWPARDTMVSPQHRVLVNSWRAQLLFGEDEVLVPAKALLNDHSVISAGAQAPVTYIHLLFDRHQVVTANGAPMESFQPGEMCKSAIEAEAREELFTLFPSLRSAPEDFGPAARMSLRVREGRALSLV